MTRLHLSGVYEFRVPGINKTYVMIRRRWWLALPFWCGVVVASFVAAFVLAVFALIVFSYYSDYGLTDDHGNPIDWNRLDRGDYKKASVVYDRNGKFIGTHFTEVRSPVAFEKIPRTVVEAFIAAEDKRFWNHPGPDGVDLIAVTRALFYDALHYAKISSQRQVGASTIAMQFAKTFHASDVAAFRTRGSYETNLQKAQRKYFEMRFAVRLCKRYDRKKIMEGFLNTIWFGDGVYGIWAAEYHYFGIDLNAPQPHPQDGAAAIRQAVMLSALNKSAILFNPIYREPKKPAQREGEDAAAFAAREDLYRRKCLEEKDRIIRSRLRWNWNLQRMREEQSIDAALFAQARFLLAEPWQQSELRIMPLKGPDNSHVNRFAKESLLTSGFNDKDITTSEGYAVFTTIDLEMQKHLSEIIRAWMQTLNSELPPEKPGHPETEHLQAAAVLMEIETSRILAMYGGDNEANSSHPLNRFMSIRSAGSASKLAVYLNYMKQTGASYGDLLPNEPFTMTERVDASGRATKRWSPKNFQEKRPVPYGMRRIDEVFTRSVNLPALWAARKTGMPSLVSTAHRLGLWGSRGVVRDPNGKVVLRTLVAAQDPENGKIRFTVPDDASLKDGIDPYLPTAIAMNVNLIELAGAFATVGRRGVYLAPSFIREVRDAENKVVYAAPAPEPMQVFDPETCRKMIVLLRGVTEVGTLKISMRDVLQKLAAKTGTGHGAMDVQVVLFTPEYVLVIRIGYDHPRPIALPVYMKRASGDGSLVLSAGWVVGPLARQWVDDHYKNRPVVPFPDDVEVDVEQIKERYKNN